MRKLAVWLVALGLMVAPAAVRAASEGEKEKEVAAATKPDPKAETAKKTAEKAKTEEPAKSGSNLEIEIQQLRDMIQAQAQELAEQREALRAQQARTEALIRQLAAAQPTAAPSLTAQPNGAGSMPGTLAANTASPDPGGAPIAKSGGAAPQGGASEDGPASLKFKGVTLTPGGFFAAETVWRQRGLVADDNTPFNTVPFSGSSQAHLSEFNATGRPSRITMLVEGKAGVVKMSGYYEADFLGAGTTSNSNGSNSYVLRQRQFWAKAALDNGWTFTGGQMWSLVTETKKGMDNRTEAVPMVIDHNYTIGFSWARQYGFRIAKSFHDKVWLGMSVEGAQTTLTAHGNANNFLIAAPGASGGLYNSLANYSFNTTPDFVVKAVFEPGWGHYEIFGIVGVTRSRVFPCATASVASPCSVNGTTVPSGVGAFNDERPGGGFGANIRVPVKKKTDLGLHVFAGDGIGRYGTSGLPVTTVRPNGTLSLLHSYQALGTVELHPHSKLDIYFNFGGEYVSRAPYLNASGGAVGYGSPLFSNAGCNSEILPTNQNTPAGPGTCTGDTRVLFEGSLGFWYRFYKGSKGTLQFGTQYSYIGRGTWTGASGTTGIGVAPKGTENMIMTSFRYYIP